MISGLHKFLLIILVLLQFVAPLVHAHSGDFIALEGLHIPELEILPVHHDSPSLISTHPQDNQHSIVSIANGIKHRKANLCDNSLNYLPVSRPAAKLTVIYYEINFSPQLIPFVKNILINSQSPRAPPFS